MWQRAPPCFWLKQELTVVVGRAASGLKLDSGKTDNTIAEGHKTYSTAGGQLSMCQPKYSWHANTTTSQSSYSINREQPRVC